MGSEFICMHCGLKEVGNVCCPQGHYVCDGCHGESSFEIIRNQSFSAKGSDPLLIAEEMIKTTPLPMLGCEHAWIAAGALLAAIRNHGKFKITDDMMDEALNRTRKQAIGAYCGLTGVCGVAPAIGSVFSVILGAACPKDKETASVMRVVSRIVEAIANQTGPCCCKNFVRTALSLSLQLVKEFLDIELTDPKKIICRDSHRHPHGCRQAKCHYYSVP